MGLTARGGAVAPFRTSQVEVWSWKIKIFLIQLTYQKLILTPGKITGKHQSDSEQKP
jgi:hypothetical protein